MKIIYVAKHGPHDNQDEDAITHALRQLGHHVTIMSETAARSNLLSKYGIRTIQATHDVLLFNKWEDLDAMRRIGMPKAFWYFDLIKSDDWELTSRSSAREKWMREVTPLCVTGFCTDGDWVKYWNGQREKGTDTKLHWLMQGADERVIGPGEYKQELACDILFTGSTIHGGKRISHIDHLKQTWGTQFKTVGHHPKERIHGRALADLYASAKVIIAPDGPVTDRYWSNRVYLTLGFGGFLLHPSCSGLHEQYSAGHEIMTYRNRDELDELIEYFLSKTDERQAYQEAGYRATISEHLYRHRCEELINVVETCL